MDYYLQVNDEQKGPYALSQIQGMWNSGAITSDSLYWNAESEEWKSVREIIESPNTPSPPPTPSPTPPPVIDKLPPPVLPHATQQPAAVKKTTSVFKVIGVAFLFLILVSIWFVEPTGNTGKQKAKKPIKAETLKNLLKHSIHKEDVYEAPIKTQVILVVLIEDKEMDEQKIKDLLNHLYDKTIKRSGFKHHAHPTNIFIYAYTSKDKAESGRGQWVGMISKSYSDKNPKIDISDTQLNALTEVAENRWGLTQKQRQEVWDKIIRLEDKAQNEANKIYPLDKPGITLDDVRKNGALMDKLKEKYENELAKEYGVGKAIIDSVATEGLKKGWAFPR
jgi:hypothetical protein